MPHPNNTKKRKIPCRCNDNSGIQCMIHNPPFPMPNNNVKEKKREIDTGRFSHETMEITCVCGHALGFHSAESTKDHQPCFIQDFVKDIECPCEKFKKLKSHV